MAISLDEIEVHTPSSFQAGRMPKCTTRAHPVPQDTSFAAPHTLAFPQPTAPRTQLNPLPPRPSVAADPPLPRSGLLLSTPPQHPLPPKPQPPTMSTSGPLWGLSEKQEQHAPARVPDTRPGSAFDRAFEEIEVLDLTGTSSVSDEAPGYPSGDAYVEPVGERVPRAQLVECVDLPVSPLEGDRAALDDMRQPDSSGEPVSIDSDDRGGVRNPLEIGYRSSPRKSRGDAQTSRMCLDGQKDGARRKGQPRPPPMVAVQVQIPSRRNSVRVDSSRASTTVDSEVADSEDADRDDTGDSDSLSGEDESYACAAPSKRRRISTPPNPAKTQGAVTRLLAATSVRKEARVAEGPRGSGVAFTEEELKLAAAVTSAVMEVVAKHRMGRSLADVSLARVATSATACVDGAERGSSKGCADAGGAVSSKGMEERKWKRGRWSRDEDALLLPLVRECRPLAEVAVERLFPLRIPSSVEKRYAALREQEKKKEREKERGGKKLNDKRFGYRVSGKPPQPRTPARTAGFNIRAVRPVKAYGQLKPCPRAR
ncbi:uncharacterized protein GIQ15_03664 [Arthroderma uncinatum]|uniref:uncharacterized protein n=1 Tax=Arthroderma uncinatum TaxID=74035 RepID=UPI00144AE6F5|nr:uncharacterized protein GIQ15_03664 [Arthroderma uncinatum]KAF3484340.1 hypothetical protein GIQ15_03664 [Arthroderma uncinatum]